MHALCGASCDCQYNLNRSCVFVIDFSWFAMERNLDRYKSMTIEELNLELQNEGLSASAADAFEGNRTSAACSRARCT